MGYQDKHYTKTREKEISTTFGKIYGAFDLLKNLSLSLKIWATRFYAPDTHLLV